MLSKVCDIYRQTETQREREKADVCVTARELELGGLILGPPTLSIGL